MQYLKQYNLIEAINETAKLGNDILRNLSRNAAFNAYITSLKKQEDYHL